MMASGVGGHGLSVRVDLIKILIIFPSVSKANELGNEDINEIFEISTSLSVSLDVINSVLLLLIFLNTIYS